MNLLNALCNALATTQLQSSTIFETYYFRNHLAVELKVAYTLPVHVHVEFDAIVLGLVNIDVGKANGDVTKVDLSETQISKRTRERRREDRLDSFFDDIGACDADVWPEILDDVIEKAWFNWVSERNAKDRIIIYLLVQHPQRLSRHRREMQAPG
jgi:hypothetical protein